MLTEAELAEMMDIRRKMDALQARYNELATKMLAGGAPALAPMPGMPAAAPAAPAAAPVTNELETQKLSGPGQIPGMPAPAPVVAPAMAPTVPPAVPRPVAAGATINVLGGVPPTTIAAPGVPVRQIKDMIVDIVIKASKPISFEDIYKRLEEIQAPLPKEKPKLLVRQILYNKNTFQVGNNGAFTLTPIAAAAARDAKNKTIAPIAPPTTTPPA